MQARTADAEGFVEHVGVKIHYEVYGDGGRTILLLPTWTIIHKRIWKLQVPYLARHYRVVSLRRPGQRPLRPAARPGGLRPGRAGRVRPRRAGRHRHRPGRRRGAVPRRELGARARRRAPRPGPRHRHDRRLDRARRPAGPRRSGGLDDRAAPDLPPSSVPRARHRPADALGEVQPPLLAGRTTRTSPGSSSVSASPSRTRPRRSRTASAGPGRPTGEVLVAESQADRRRPGPTDRGLVRPADAARCCAVHGERRPGHPARAQRGARRADRRATGRARGRRAHPAGPRPGAVQPAHPRVRRRGSARARRRRRSWTPVEPPAASGCSTCPRRSGSATPGATSRSPQELRRLQPGRRRSTGSPSTRSPGCWRRPASGSTRRAGWLANESAHIESESGEHDLHVFQALRRMDEILVANFMVFHDVVRGAAYDLVVGDEAWDVDHFLHENPELKRFAYAWMTDFVGYLPMPDGGDREALVTADYNAEMIEHIARYPRLRDRADLRRRPGRHRRRAVRPGPAVHPRLDAGPLRLRRVRHRLRPGAVRRPGRAARPSSGTAPTSRCAWSPSAAPGVGGHLLRRVVDAYPRRARRVPGLRMVVVTGPRIDPGVAAGRPGPRGARRTCPTCTGTWPPATSRWSKVD